MGEAYGVRPSSLAGMDEADVMERLTFDLRCFNAHLRAQPKKKKGGVLVGDG